MADVESTVSALGDMLAGANVRLKAAIEGVIRDSEISLSGAVGGLNFSGLAILRANVTGNLSGVFTWPPTNIPVLEATNQSVVLSVVFVQDNTGGRTIDLEALFAGAGAQNIYGLPLVDDSPGGQTQVDIIARRSGSTTAYTVLLAPLLDAGQIGSGIIDAALLPVATGVDPGVVTLANGSGSAASGNHTHATWLPIRFTIEANGAALTSGDFDLHDMPASGTVIRMTGVVLTGTGSPTATLTVKISGSPVTGTGTAATALSASGDANATLGNTFVARQKVQISMTITGGTVNMATGSIHCSVNSEPWAG